MKVWIDGCSLGNPGFAGTGCVIEHNGKIGISSSYYRHATNNEAEYYALIDALFVIVADLVSDSSIPVTIYSDSQLVVNQFNGYFKVIDKRMSTLFAIAHGYWDLLNNQKELVLIPREENKLADKLAKGVALLQKEVINGFKNVTPSGE